VVTPLCPSFTRISAVPGLIAAIKYGESGYPPPQLYRDALEQGETTRRAAKRQEEEAAKRVREGEERQRLRRAEEKFSNLPESEQKKLLAEQKAQLLALPEWANQKPSVVNILIGSTARAAIIEELLRRESAGEER